MPTLTRLLLALAVIPFLPHAIPAQPGADAALARIRQEVQRIEALRLRARHTIRLEGFSAEGGEARVFLERGRLAKVEAMHFGESGRTAETLYFRDGALVFVFQRSIRYDRLFGRVQSTEEDRYYFDRNRMIVWLGPDRKPVPRSHPRYSEEEAHRLRFAARLVSAVRSRARTLAPE
jgi:hypothetical protein